MDGPDPLDAVTGGTEITEPSRPGVSINSVDRAGENRGVEGITWLG
jgi:hypothetical protein